MTLRHSSPTSQSNEEVKVKKPSIPALFIKNASVDVDFSSGGGMFITALLLEEK
ncbi:hypothetical protein [Bacillus sp. SA1-12]|uniref:hypothetical protein n=1 Tax=Bacillus sp. SA1-12 TaxID=1455638 RepID=UPI000AF3F377|nr:hypothetical protein [Bacillus sp. SA1-12]